MKRIKHRTKMRRRIMNHSVYGRVYTVISSQGFWGMSRKMKGRHVGNPNTGL